MCRLGQPSIPLLLHRYSQYPTGEHANRLGEELSPSLVAKLCKSGVCVPYRPFLTPTESRPLRPTPSPRAARRPFAETAPSDSPQCRGCPILLFRS